MKMKKNWKNRLVALALTATTALSCAAIGTASSISSSAATYYAGGCGDVNLDYKINSADVLAIQQYCVSSRVLITFQKKNADVNGDGYVDADDVIVLQKYLVGSYPYLPFDSTYKTGDVNCNGTIDVRDLIKLESYVNSSAPLYLSTAVKCACDVNWDGKVNSTDVTILTKHLVGLIDCLPYTG